MNNGRTESEVYRETVERPFCTEEYRILRIEEDDSGEVAYRVMHDDGTRGMFAWLGDFWHDWQGHKVWAQKGRAIPVLVGPGHCNADAEKAAREYVAALIAAEIAADKVDDVGT